MFQSEEYSVTYLSVGVTNTKIVDLVKKVLRVWRITGSSIKLLNAPAGFILYVLPQWQYRYTYKTAASGFSGLVVSILWNARLM